MKFFDKPIEKSALKTRGSNHSPENKNESRESQTKPTIIPATKLEVNSQKSTAKIES